MYRHQAKFTSSQNLICAVIGSLGILLYELWNPNYFIINSNLCVKKVLQKKMNTY